MNKKRGYIALMTVIVIALLLLGFIAEAGMSGASLRFSVLNEEAKTQTEELARGCVDQSVLQLQTNPWYRGDATTTVLNGTCYVAPIERDAEEFVQVKVQAVVRRAVTNLVVTLRAEDFTRMNTREIPTSKDP